MFGLIPISSSAWYERLLSADFLILELGSFQSPTIIAFAGQASPQAVLMSPSATGRCSFLAVNLPSWIRCTQNEHFSITPRVLTVTDRKSTRLNSSHVRISYAVFC